MHPKQAFPQARSRKVFGRRPSVGLYVCVSTHDQQTLSFQIRAMREYAAKRRWTIVTQIKEVGSGAFQREMRATLVAAARRREICFRRGRTFNISGWDSFLSPKHSTSPRPQVVPGRDGGQSSARDGYRSWAQVYHRVRNIMYDLAGKILPLFLDPLVLAIVLLVVSFLLRKRRPKVFQITYVVSVILLLAAGCPTVEGWLTGSLEGQYPDAGADSYPSVQAIVVLGGTIHMPSMAHHASGIINPSDRLLMALRLYHAGKAPLVVLSGGNNPLFSGRVPEQSEAEVMRQLLMEWGIPDAAIQVEGGSINTRENALFSHRLLAARGIGRIILVTSAFHMPRAAAAFRKVGFDVVAAPADFQTGWEKSSAMFRWVPEAAALVGSSKAMREWLGLWVYRLRGWI